MKTVIYAFAIFVVLLSCSEQDGKNHVYDGRLDTEVIRLSARSAGTVEKLTVDEGMPVRKGQLLVQIDTIRAHLQLQRQKAQLAELAANRRMLQTQITQAKAQLDFGKRTLEKTKKMTAKGAATEQKLDELQTQVRVQQARLTGLMKNMDLIAAKKEQIEAAMKLTRESMRDAALRAPLDGLVLNKLLSEGEWAAPGMPVLELADLSRLEATIYVSLLALDNIKPGQEAEVSIDGSDSVFSGKVKWISSVAEFTPKTILTQETRNSLVYAVKINVPNPDYKLKIGMPVMVRLQHR